MFACVTSSARPYDTGIISSEVSSHRGLRPYDQRACHAVRLIAAAPGNLDSLLLRCVDKRIDLFYDRIISVIWDMRFVICAMGYGISITGLNLNYMSGV